MKLLTIVFVSVRVDVNYDVVVDGCYVWEFIHILMFVMFKQSMVIKGK